ncbi:MAG: BrnT family toxin [Methermicoccaceae archaeon]
MAKVRFDTNKVRRHIINKHNVYPYEVLEITNDLSNACIRRAKRKKRYAKGRRYMIIGKTKKERLLTVIVEKLNGDYLLITARPANDQETDI